MLGRILLLLMLLPVLEIAVLVWLAGFTNWLVVLGILVGAGILGAFLARQQGIRSLARLSREMNPGQMPADAMFDAVIVSLAAVLLILPGLLSDVVAIGLLFPPTRSLFKATLRRNFQARVVTSRFDTYDARDQIIDVQVLDSQTQRLN